MSFLFLKKNGIDKINKLNTRNDLTITDEAKALYNTIYTTVSNIYKTYGADVYREVVYTSILGVELENQGYMCKREEKLSIIHKGIEVGTLIADLIAEGQQSFVIEAKKTDIYKALKQIIGYMRAANLDYGFVVGYLKYTSDVWMIFRDTDIHNKVTYYVYNKEDLKELSEVGVL